MTASAKTSFGVQIWMGPAGGTLVKVAELLTVTPPGRTRESIDVTSHDSIGGAMEFIASAIYDSGEVPCQTHYIAGSAGDDAMITAITDGVTRDFKIVVKAATGTEDMEFSGHLTSYAVAELPVNGKQAADTTIKVSGPITQAASS